MIAASSPELMENFIEEDDLVILGNRYESQLCAIEMNASLDIHIRSSNIANSDQSFHPFFIKNRERFHIFFFHTRPCVFDGCMTSNSLHLAKKEKYIL